MRTRLSRPRGIIFTWWSQAATIMNNNNNNNNYNNYNNFHLSFLSSSSLGGHRQRIANWKVKTNILDPAICFQILVLVQMWKNQNIPNIFLKHIMVIKYILLVLVQMWKASSIELPQQTTPWFLRNITCEGNIYTLYRIVFILVIYILGSWGTPKLSLYLSLRLLGFWN